jgi:small subunit ribosomal protein S17
MAQAIRRRRVGRVLSNHGDKTIVVQVETFRRHRIYRKATRIRRKLMAHDPENTCQIGDMVEVESSRPLSRRKRWRLIEVVERAELTAEERAAAFAVVEEDVAVADPAPEADVGATAASGEAEGQATTDQPDVAGVEIEAPVDATDAAAEPADEPDAADVEIEAPADEPDVAAEPADEPDVADVEIEAPADATDAAAEADPSVEGTTDDDEESEDDKA